MKGKMIITGISAIGALLSVGLYAYQQNIPASAWAGVALIWILNVLIREIFED